jgi:hypothetical protein
VNCYCIKPIGQYAARMKSGISHERPVLIGVSFGGMMAIEIAKFIPASTVILVSSIRGRGQRPTWMTVSGWLRLDRLVSGHNSLVSGHHSPVSRPYPHVGIFSANSSRRSNTIFWAWRPGRMPPFAGISETSPILNLSAGQSTKSSIGKMYGHLMIYNRPEAVGNVFRQPSQVSQLPQLPEFHQIAVKTHIKW